MKDQAQHLIREQKIDLQIRLALVILKEKLEGQINNGFDSKLSKMLDCIIYLLESDNGLQAKSQI